MPDFLETPRFPGCPNFNFSSDPEYRVVITRTASGFEKRNRSWAYPLARITVSVGPRREEEIQELLEFFHAVGGAAVGFRFKDYTDFKSCQVQATVSALDQPLVEFPDSPGFYQVTKRYQYGSLTQDRAIYKPISPLLVADNGTLKSEGGDYTVDYTSGRVDLNFSPVGSLTWGGEFDLPVRFDSGFPVEIVDQRIESVQFALQELRMSGSTE